MAIQLFHQTDIFLGVAAIALAAYVYQSRTIQRQVSPVVIPVRVHNK